MRALGPFLLRSIDMAQQTALEAIIEPAVMAVGYEFVGLEYFPRREGALLRIYIDGEHGVPLDACAQVSRQISAVLDVEDPITGHYSLEVSSPGLERRLFKVEHFARFIGKKAKIRLKSPRDDNRRNFSGMIESVIGQTIHLVGEQSVTIDFDDIDKAHLVAEI
jgi:ribosome maturation factor RimP